MLAQFQARYPTGNLISELLTIYQGKFVVRVSAIVEGVTRATGMAASDSLELAEDQARSRALMVLGIQDATSAQYVASTPQTAANQVQMQPVETAFSPESMRRMNQRRPQTTAGLDDPAYSYVSQASPQEESTPAPTVSPRLQGFNSDRSPLTPPTPAQEPDAPVENFGIMSQTQTGSSSNPPIPFDNVTPLMPRSYNPQETAGALGQTGAQTEEMTSEPTDLSDAIARTTVEMKRLKWTNQQGREHLLRTYAKKSRQDLTDEEMLEFLHYLESQPSP